MSTKGRKIQDASHKWQGETSREIGLPFRQGAMGANVRAIFAALRETLSPFQSKYRANLAIYRVEDVLRRIINREIVRSGQNGMKAVRRKSRGENRCTAAAARQPKREGQKYAP
jgi:hypothetical protein